MDNFRWILLGVGIFIVVVIYLISRKNRRDFYRDDENQPEDLPDIATTNWDDLEEGVGEVRIVAHTNDEAMDYASAESKDYLKVDRDGSDYYDEDDALMAVYRSSRGSSTATAPEPAEVQTPVSVPEIEPAAAPVAEDEPATKPAPSETVLVLNIVARDGSSLHGDSINSVAHANNMVFGDMNIYHHLDRNDQPDFSMINMVKPGSFDPASIHNLSTPGISLFMQLPGPENASDAFTDMLQTAYRMSEILEARLCDQRREPLTESVVEEYRNIAASFDGRV